MTQTEVLEFVLYINRLGCRLISGDDGYCLIQRKCIFFWWKWKTIVKFKPLPDGKIEINGVVK
jgi:hypothetical protein